ncbi:MAG: BMP family ABC transporter substrate-binding protein [Candidatus Atribacteria bacterium]
MKLRNVLIFGLVVILVFAFAGLGLAKEKVKVIMVTDTAGLGDKSFNDSVWDGIKKAEKDFGIESKIIESREMADYVPNLTGAIKDGANIVVGVGFLMIDALAEVAPQYPDTKFIFIDAVVDSPNVAGCIFNEQEIGFLSGVFMGMMTKTGTVGWVGGMFIPPVERFEVGIRAGLLTVNALCNTDVEIKIGYVGSFEDVPKAKSMTLTQMGQGADIVFAGGGTNTLGIFEAAKEKGESFYAIGVDQDQDYIQPGSILTSAMKRVDVAVYKIIEDYINGEFKGGVHSMGLEGNFLSLSPMKYTKQLVPYHVFGVLDILREAVVKGKIKLPKTRDELKEFQPPVSLIF